MKKHILPTIGTLLIIIGAVLVEYSIATIGTLIGILGCIILITYYTD